MIKVPKFMLSKKRVVIFTCLTVYLIFNLFSSFADSTLKNITSANNRLDTAKNIFFIETSSNEENGELSLNSRQACSIESAALMNPTHLICVITVNNSKLKNSQIIQSLRKYQNIVFYRMNIEDFSLNSPVESWVKSKQIYKTVFEKENISDLLRFLLLWR